MFLSVIFDEKNAFPRYAQITKKMLVKFLVNINFFLASFIPV